MPRGHGGTLANTKAERQGETVGITAAMDKAERLYKP